MKGPGDEVRLLLTILLACWVMSYGYSLFEFQKLGPAFEHFRAGGELSLALHFLGWQAIAGVFGLAVYGVSRLWPKGSAMRQLCSVPFLLAVLLAGGFAVMFLVGSAP